jgi:hypothetical protein
MAEMEAAECCERSSEDSCIMLEGGGRLLAHSLTHSLMDCTARNRIGSCLEPYFADSLTYSLTHSLAHSLAVTVVGTGHSKGSECVCVCVFNSVASQSASQQTSNV